MGYIRDDEIKQQKSSAPTPASKWSKAELVILAIAIAAANVGWWFGGFILKDQYAP